MDSFFRKENRIPCPPKMDEIKSHVSEYLDEFEDEENMEEVNTMISCVEDYLNLYNMFATGRPPEDSLIKEIYDKTMKMLDKAKESREFQKNALKEKVNNYDSQLAEMCEDDDGSWYCEELKDAIFYGNELLKSFDYDFKVIKETKDYCTNAKNKSEKTICVEKFVHTAHERGPYIPLGCGGYLPETLSQRLEEDEPLSLMEKITPEVEKETNRVLTCLKTWKPWKF